MPAREAWILAGVLDEVPAYPPLLTDVGGCSHLLRLACEAALAGATTVFVVWQSPEPPPDISAIASDPRIAARATLAVCREVPQGPAGDPILVLRGDRIFHRDLPKAAALAWNRSRAPAVVAKVAGAEHDAVLVARREDAARIARMAPAAGGIGIELAALDPDTEIASAPPPYLAFTTAASDRTSLRRAEWRLIRSLRKSHDGIASRVLNRHLSLPLTRLLARTPVIPNHITILAFACALAGAFVIARGGYTSGVLGMLLVEFGSIIDGVDGELARLRFQFSRTGQWLDTLADDVGNVAYTTGIMVSLSASGVSWATPLWLAALGAFLATQVTQYYLIATVYHSGDLAAIPWAFQSSEFLSRQPEGLVARVRATVPKLMKRDFALTAFTVLALLGRLDVVLAIYAAGALGFCLVFFVQMVVATRREGVG